MRKRNKSPLGPSRAARSIPIPIAIEDTGRGQRSTRATEPGLSFLSAQLSDLRPPSVGGIASMWTSWSAHDQEADFLVGPWETPAIDDELLSGGGIGFPPAKVAPPEPITIDDAVTASVAGWAPADSAPERSWLGALVDIERTSARDAERTPAPSPASTPTMSRLDPEDFTARLDRGAAFATSEAQLTTLTERALQRLSSEGASRWLVADAHGALSARISVGDTHHAGCAVRDVGQCPAIISGQTQRFDSSSELDACPHLLVAEAPDAAVICVPTSGHHRWVGVVQTTSTVGDPLDATRTALLEHTVQTIATRLDALGGND